MVAQNTPIVSEKVGDELGMIFAQALALPEPKQPSPIKVEEEASRFAKLVGQLFVSAGLAASPRQRCQAGRILGGGRRW